MKSFISIIVLYFFVLLTSSLFAQSQEKKVVITGVRFSYPLVEKWIEGYKVTHPEVSVIIESRSVTDPEKYDLLIEAYEPEKAVRENREFLYLAKYALLPVANRSSAFARAYSEKGLTTDLIKQAYFNDIYSDKKQKNGISVNYTVYTRLQKAGAPVTFSSFFGYEQANIKGKAIAGSDEHLIKGVLNDTTAISYSVPGLLFDLKTRKQIDGLTIIPVDADGNGRVTSEELFYENLDAFLKNLEEGDLKNVPIGQLHLSISKNSANDEALKFLQWVASNSQETLNDFGFLKADPRRFKQEKAKFEVAIN